MRTGADGALTARYSLFREGALADFSTSILISPRPEHPGIVDNTNPALTNLAVKQNQNQNLMASKIAVAKQSEPINKLVESINDAARQRNSRIIAVLHETTGQDLGDKPAKWWTWWLQDYNDWYDIGNGGRSADESGPFKSAYENESPTPQKPVYQSVRESEYALPAPATRPYPQSQPYPSPQPYSPIPQQSRMQIQVSGGLVQFPHSCFAPGTKVWALAGRTPIEQIKIGDRVLAQDVESGQLAYKPVMAVTIRPPGPRMKIGLDSETITSTRSHPFWVLGEGWQMTKQLEAGKNLHSLRGAVQVETLEDQAESDQSAGEPAYNLVVADFSTYFIGDKGILVHDNTPRRPTAAVVPGLTAQAPAADKNQDK